MSTTMEPQLGIQRIGQVSVPVRDLPRATAFYRDVLALRLWLEVPGMAFFDCGGIRVMLAVAEDPEFDHRSSILYYQVADIEGMHATLVSHGVRIMREPHMIADMKAYELWMSFFRDTEDNVLALMCEKPGKH
jgi:predicted enzyme related to lactoylglutathione lyase